MNPLKMSAPELEEAKVLFGYIAKAVRMADEAKSGLIRFDVRSDSEWESIDRIIPLTQVREAAVTACFVEIAKWISELEALGVFIQRIF